MTQFEKCVVYVLVHSNFFYIYSYIYIQMIYSIEFFFFIQFKNDYTKNRRTTITNE